MWCGHQTPHRRGTVLENTVLSRNGSGPLLLLLLDGVSTKPRLLVAVQVDPHRLYSSRPVNNLITIFLSNSLSSLCFRNDRVVQVESGLRCRNVEGIVVDLVEV